MDSALLGLVGVSAAVMTAAVLYQQATKPKYTKPNSANKGSASKSAKSSKTHKIIPSNSASKLTSIPVKSNFKETEKGALEINPNPVHFGYTG